MVQDEILKALLWLCGVVDLFEKTSIQEMTEFVGIQRVVLRFVFGDPMILLRIADDEPGHVWLQSPLEPTRQIALLNNKRLPASYVTNRLYQRVRFVGTCLQSIRRPLASRTESSDVLAWASSARCFIEILLSMGANFYQSRS